MSSTQSMDGVSPSVFRVAVRASTDRTVVLALGGEVDLATVSELRDALTVSIRVGVRHLILDCADLTFLDASGVGALVVASNDLSARNGKLVLRNPSTPVRIVFEAAGLRELLERSGPEPMSTRGDGLAATTPGSLSR